MSKLNDQLKLYQGDAVALPDNLVSAVMQAEQDYTPYSAPRGFRYSLEARFGVSFVATEQELDAKMGLTSQIVKNARTAIVEGIFGEFREPMIKLRMALDNRDYYEASRLHNELLHRMFDV